MVWLEEKPEHANSDLGMYWKMGVDTGSTNSELAAADTSRGLLAKRG